MLDQAMSITVLIIVVNQCTFLIWWCNTKQNDFDSNQHRNNNPCLMNPMLLVRHMVMIINPRTKRKTNKQRPAKGWRALLWDTEERWKRKNWSYHRSAVEWGRTRESGHAQEEELRLWTHACGTFPQHRHTRDTLITHLWINIVVRIFTTLNYDGQ